MSRKPAPKWDDPEESKRFLDAAKAVEASDDPAEFERALKLVAPKKRGSEKTKGPAEAGPF